MPIRDVERHRELKLSTTHYSCICILILTGATEEEEIRKKKKGSGTMDDKRRDSAGSQTQTASVMETPSSEPPSSRRRGGGQKRKSTSINSGGGGGSSSQMTSSKRQAREKPPPVPFPPIHMNGPLTRARVQPYNSSSLSEVAPVKSEAETREAAAKAEMSRLSENWEALEAKIEAEYDAIISRDANAHVIPVHAG